MEGMGGAPRKVLETPSRQRVSCWAVMRDSIPMVAVTTGNLEQISA